MSKSSLNVQLLIIDGQNDFGPGFLQRRMGSRRGVINTFAKMGITHADDISIAGFCFED